MGRSDFPEGETVPIARLLVRKRRKEGKEKGESWSVGVSRELENDQANFFILFFLLPCILFFFLVRDYVLLFIFISGDRYLFSFLAKDAV